jgi:hypothetical protein
VTAGFDNPSCQKRRLQVIERNETSRVRPGKRLMARNSAVTLLFWLVLAATTAMAQQSVGTVTETVTTRRDLNGRDVVSEQVVTHRARTNGGEERVIIEIYLPSMEAGRLALTQRINRVTTLTKDGSQTIEEAEKPSRVSPGDPLRVVRRSVTTMRRSGSDSYVSERQVFELDVNGRFVPVLTQTEHNSGH